MRWGLFWRPLDEPSPDGRIEGEVESEKERESVEGWIFKKGCEGGEPREGGGEKDDAREIAQGWGFPFWSGSGEVPEAPEEGELGNPDEVGVIPRGKGESGKGA